MTLVKGSPHRILVMAPAWIGDMVMAQSLVSRLTELHPGAGIDLVAPPATAAIGARMPGVGKVFTIDAAHGRFGLAMRMRLARQLKAERHDLAIVLPGSWKSALVPFLAGIARRRGYLGEMRFGLLNERRKLDQHRLPRTVDRFVALAEPDGAEPRVAPPQLVADLKAGKALAAKLALPLDRPLLAIAAGAEYGPAKRWPAENFAAVAAEAARRGFRPVLFGTKAETAIGADLAARIAAATGEPPVDLTGATTILEVIDLLALASALVCNDSGLMHVGAALGLPLVAVYGSSSSTMTPPLSAAARVAEIPLECRPCFKRTCPLGHSNCLKGVTAEMVGGTLWGLVKAPRRTG